MKKPVQAYGNGKIVVRFDPKICTHSGNCVKSLPTVFNINHKPWIDVDGDDTDRIIETVQACPSKALSFEVPNS